MSPSVGKIPLIGVVMQEVVQHTARCLQPYTFPDAPSNSRDVDLWTSPKAQASPPAAPLRTPPLSSQRGWALRHKARTRATMAASPVAANAAAASPLARPSYKFSSMSR